MQRHFFLYSYHSVKKKVSVLKKDSNGRSKPQTETKTEWVRNSDERDQFIKQFGLKKFDEAAVKGGRFENYVDIPVPAQYAYIWEHFLTMWAYAESDMMGNKVFTFRTLKDYLDCMGYEFTNRDKLLVMKMRTWAQEVISELNKEDKE